MKDEFLKIEIQNKKKGMSACIHSPLQQPSIIVKTTDIQQTKNYAYS